MQRILKFLGFVLLFLLPGTLLAANMNPYNGANAWNLYVMGNGDAIGQILTAIKLLINTKSFHLLLLFMGLLGFLVLAIQAGFDPGKNLMKMFGYLFIIWTVSYTSTNLTANVRVADSVTGYDNVVKDVPAVVAIPSSLISEIGNWMASNIETAFSLPSELSMTQKGSFDLFGQMMQDAGNFTITNPELKKSLAAFAGDCVVPSLARSTLTAKQMKETNNLWQLYANAASPALFTRYYNSDPTKSVGMSPGNTASSGSTGSSSSTSTSGTTASGTTTSAYTCNPTTSPLPAGVTNTNESFSFDSGLGATVSCAEAYICLNNDLHTHATDLLNAKQSQWAATGTLAPYATEMQVAIETAAGGQNTGAAGLAPSDLILQEAMINQVDGSFRQAAVQAGDNEILLNANLSQAFQQQKSVWVTGTAIFQHMMGYVFTVLQAFIFGLVPIVIVALMIPGLGKQIFVSFGQILIWLTLWRPMFAIINFLILVFSKQTFSHTWALTDGPSLQTKYTLDEQTSNLVTAAQFMGTMVPLIAWSLVKGSMAFTEFIAHGIGGNLANTAGMSAATGNFSTGNVSMDNVSGHKYNTASSSVVGNQATNVYSGAGAGLVNHELGGNAISMNGSGASKSMKHSEGLAHHVDHTLKAGHGVNDNHSTASKTGVNHSERFSNSTSDSNNHSVSVGDQRGLNVSINDGTSASDSHGRHADHGHQAGDNTTHSDSFGANAGWGHEQSYGESGGGSGGGSSGSGNGQEQQQHQHQEDAKHHGKPIKSNIGGTIGNTLNHSNSDSFSAGHGETSRHETGHSHSLASSQTAGHNWSDIHTRAHQQSHGHDISGGRDSSAERGATTGDGYNLGNDWSRGSKFTADTGWTISMNSNISMRDLDSFYTSTEMDDEKSFSLMMGERAAEWNSMEHIHGTQHENAGAYSHIESAIPSAMPAGIGGFPGGGESVQQTVQRVDSDINANKKKTDKDNAVLEGMVGRERGGLIDGAHSWMPTSMKGHNAYGVTKNETELDDTVTAAGALTMLGHATQGGRHFKGLFHSKKAANSVNGN